MSSTCTVTPSASSIRARASLRGVRSSFRPQIFATKTRRAKSTVTAGFVKYGVREDPPPGDTSFGFLETYGLDLGGGSIQRETLKFGKGSVAVSLDVLRPLGIVFEDVNGKCVAVEVLDGSNAEKAGVKQGDTLRMCGAVAVGKSRVTVAKWAVEPSLDQRKRELIEKLASPRTACRLQTPWTPFGQTARKWGGQLRSACRCCWKDPCLRNSKGM